ncbi:MAG: Fe-S cluster assembly sulfur transfer protein SufU [Nevskiales bacterium]
MSDLRDLYQEVVIDHGRKPRNFRTPAAFTHEALGHNPLCGDKLHLYLSVEADRIGDIAFTGSGCAISTASASLMSEHLKGKTLAETDAVFQAFHQMLTRPDALPPSTDTLDQLDKLAVLSGVHEYPTRVKCATLPWHTLQAALKHDQTPAKTE